MKEIMTVAHLVTKELVTVVGDYRIAFQMALKAVWAKFKRVGFVRTNVLFVKNLVNEMTRKNNPVADFIFGIPTWIVHKNLDGIQADVVLNYAWSCETVRETEKAELLRFGTKMGSIQMWCPKSVMAK